MKSHQHKPPDKRRMTVAELISTIPPDELIEVYIEVPGRFRRIEDYGYWHVRDFRDEVGLAEYLDCAVRRTITDGKIQLYIEAHPQD